MKNKGRVLGIGLITAIVFLNMLSPGASRADDWYRQDEPGFFTLFDEAGQELTAMGREMLKNDEYISGDNKHYSVIRVDKRKRSAFAKYLGDIKLPEFEEIEDWSVETAAKGGGGGSVLLYCTHSDESYVPTDGQSSIPGKGGIFKVAGRLKNGLNKGGIDAILDQSGHEPHDAGAYRRSRQTAVNLIKKNMPVIAVFDVHRDAVPKSHYETTVNGKSMSKVRMVIGKRNQNRNANEELAHKIKAIADKEHPGLVKDIYIGQGEYNQELSPRSLLFEFGTHEISREAAEKAAETMSDVIVKAIKGGTIISKPKAQTPAPGEKTTKPPKGTKGKAFKVKPISQEQPKGAGKGILKFIIVAAAGLVVFILISKSRNEIADSFAGLFGKKRRD
ncbi:MAG: stage II sporulation protein P [Clostridiales bacterium]|nr:stage II sporulation protein P [Clostridiales bacterium]